MAAILLVEDEEAIRNKLTHNTNWKENGFEHVFEAANGLEALSVLEHNVIDIMVTDIQMPKMNGIELVKECRNRNYSLKIIMISGFAEFEYAQESMKYNVSEYLLKPFASKKLLAIAQKLKGELEEERAEKIELHNLRLQLKENIPILQDKFFLDLIYGNLIASNPYADLKFLGLEHLKGKSCQTIVIEIPESRLREVTEEDKYLINLQLFHQIKRLLDEWNNHYFWLINSKINQVTVIIFDPNPEIILHMEDLLSQIHTNLKQPVTIGVGHLYPELKDLAVSYREACLALRYRYLYGVNRVFSIDDVNLENVFYHKHFHSLYQNRIFDDIRVGSFEMIKKDLNKLFDEFRQAGMIPESLQIIASNIILMTCTILNELGHNSQDILSPDISPLTDVRKAESLDELEQQLLEFFEHINAHINKKRATLNEKVVDQIRQYIDEQYATEITLSGIANQYKLSSGYLSLLFTERTGKNFSDYLTERRIKKAKELLKHTDMKIYEISNAVGYNDSFYFSNCFKKLVGINPSEYRENVET